ncbi:hypothetical protein Q7P37_007188 [Cladosporium fusiforme]
MDATVDKRSDSCAFAFSPSSESGYSSRSGSDSHQHIPDQILRRLSDEYLIAKDDGIVDFAYASPDHPRQWQLPRKFYDTSLICILECMTTIVSNAGSSINEEVAAHTGVSRTVAIFILATLYLLGQALGGLAFPPITEVFGSRVIYVSSTAVYAALCLMTGLAPSLATIIVGRFFTEMLSAMPTCVATGSLENMWDSRARIWAIAIWAAAGIFGMALGPLYAVGINESSLGWTWVFNVAGILTAVLSVLFLFTLESRPSQVLRQKVRKIERNTGFTGLRLEVASLPTFKDFAQSSLLLPLRLLVEPIVLLSSIMGATVVSLIYLFAEAIPVVYTSDTFNFSPIESALVFVIFAAGVLLFVFPRLYDVRVADRRARNEQASEPEDKLFGLLVAAPALAIGLWWFGASVPRISTNISPAVSMIPVACVGFASVEFDTVLSGYLTDVYASHAASANAPMCFLRALVSGVYPLFGRQMFEGLSPSYATFILAGMATAYVGVAFAFWKYGRAIRLRSAFAQQAASEGVYEEK